MARANSEAHAQLSSRTQDPTPPRGNRQVGSKRGEIQLDLAHNAQQAAHHLGMYAPSRGSTFDVVAQVLKSALKRLHWQRYGERASLSLLCAAIWRREGLALEEYSAFK